MKRSVVIFSFLFSVRKPLQTLRHYTFLMVQEKSNQEIDLMFKLRTLQQSMELEELEHKATKAKLADQNNIDHSIEEATSEAMKGESAQWPENAFELKPHPKIGSSDRATNPLLGFLFFEFQRWN